MWGETPQGKTLNAISEWDHGYVMCKNWLCVSLLCWILQFHASKTISITVYWHFLCLIKQCGKRHLREKLCMLSVSEWRNNLLWLTTVDSFTVPLHSPSSRQRSAKGLSLGSEKQLEFPLVMSAHNAMGHWSIPIYLQTNQSQKGDASQLEAMSVSYPTDSPIATRQGLCSSLWPLG